jgi:peptidyl-prolyl cis-trans isomerase B (cyclophilin B)
MNTALDLPRISITLRSEHKGANMTKWFTIAAALLVSAQFTFAAENPPKERKQYKEPPKMVIDVNKTYTATFTTSKGKIVCDLFPKDAPKTVNNLVFLAREKFYDDTVFHRVIANFMIQGGDPTATGSGGPGYQFEDEFKNNPHKFKVGALAMANAGPNTNGSQFFITHVVTPWLDGKHTIFGQVKEGQDVVNAIKQGDKLISVTIEEK